MDDVGDGGRLLRITNCLDKLQQENRKTAIKKKNWSR